MSKTPKPPKPPKTPKVVKGYVKKNGTVVYPYMKNEFKL